MEFKKINIIHVLSGDTFGGVEAQLLCLLDGLNVLNSKENIDLKTYIEVILFNTGILNDKLEVLKSDNPTLSDVTIIPDTSIISLVLNTLSHIKNNPAEIIVTHGYKESLLGFFAKLTLNRKWIHFFHGGTENYSGIKFFKWRVYRTLEKIIAVNFANKIISVSESLGKELAISHSPNFNIIHNSATKSEKHTNRDIDIDIQNKEALDLIKIFWIGRFVTVKRPDIAVRSYLKFKSIDPSFKTTLEMLGDGPLLSETKLLSENILIEDSQINKTINFHGFSHNVLDQITNNSIIFISSDSEGIPTVVLEGLHKKAIIVSRELDGISEIMKIVPNYPILTINSASDIEISKLLHYAVKNFTELKNKAINTDTEYFSPESLANRHTEQYCKLLGYDN